MSNQSWHRNVMRLALAVGVAGSAVSASAQTSPWKTLNWGDFAGPVPPNSPFDAETWSGADGSWEDTKDLPDSGGQKKAGLKNVRSSSSFDKGKSWVKPDKKTDALLMHEQYHFDISEYWARELEKGLRGVMGCGTTHGKAREDAKNKGEAAKTKCAADCKALQEKYDAETDHGRKMEEQKKWCAKIGALLDTCAASPPKTGGKTDGPKKMFFEPEENRFYFDPIELTSFEIGNAEVADPALYGATLVLPPLQFGGYYMDNTMAMIVPVDPNETTVSIVSADGEVLGSGNIRLIVIADHMPQMAGFFEGVTWTDAALKVSNVIGALDQELLDPSSFMTIRIDTEKNLGDLTEGFTLPAVVDSTVSVGAASCWPANPPIMEQPRSQMIKPGTRLSLSVFAPVFAELKYQWYRNDRPLADDARTTGSNAANLTIRATNSADSGRYTVRVTSGCGESLSETAKVVIGNVALMPH